MITDFIFHGLFLIIQFLLSPLTGVADATIPESISGAISTAAGFLNGVAAANPIDTLYLVLAIFLSFELVIFLTKGTIFGIKKIPFIS